MRIDLYGDGDSVIVRVDGKRVREIDTCQHHGDYGCVRVGTRVDSYSNGVVDVDGGVFLSARFGHDPLDGAWMVGFAYADLYLKQGMPPGWTVSIETVTDDERPAVSPVLVLICPDGSPWQAYVMNDDNGTAIKVGAQG